jgi:hypothetical protein
VADRRPVDVILKFVAFAAAAFCLYWLIRLYFVTTTVHSIDLVAVSVVATLKALTLGIVILVGALVARLIVRGKAANLE